MGQECGGGPALFLGMHSYSGLCLLMTVLKFDGKIIQYRSDSYSHIQILGTP